MRTLASLSIISYPKTLYVHIIRNMSHKVFVYGTLKRNEPNHHWLTDSGKGHSKFLAEGSTKTKYPLIIATKYNIPFLLHNPGDGYHVKGEIYEVDDKMLGNLDILEDHPKYYVREIDDILVKNGDTTETVQAWVYFLKKFKPNLLSREKMEDYSSKGPHGLVYMESNNESTVEDLDDVIKK
ncbi:hypothetical protein O0L34_g13269 [Tuta absoluta]|nr:hypothetical protein O0L34_g13269 [Tuta absoluta]